jgi:hypothetical protein
VHVDSERVEHGEGVLAIVTKVRRGSDGDQD